MFKETARTGGIQDAEEISRRIIKCADELRGQLAAVKAVSIAGFGKETTRISGKMTADGVMRASMMRDDIAVSTALSIYYIVAFMHTSIRATSFQPLLSSVGIMEHQTWHLSPEQLGRIRNPKLYPTLANVAEHDPIVSRLRTFYACMTPREQKIDHKPVSARRSI